MENLNIKLDFHSKTPLTEQLVREIRQLIQKQALPPGAPLPTVRKIAAQLQINFNTVARAYRVLDQEGWIITRQGRGTYVSEVVVTEAENQKEPEGISKAQASPNHREAEKITLQKPALNWKAERFITEIDHLLSLANRAKMPLPLLKELILQRLEWHQKHNSKKITYHFANTSQETYPIAYSGKCFNNCFSRKPTQGNSKTASCREQKALVESIIVSRETIM